MRGIILILDTKPPATLLEELRAVSYQKQLDNIVQKMRKAADEGSTHIHAYDLAATVVGALRSAGITVVTNTTDRSYTSHKISW